MTHFPFLLFGII
jgi:hypothetical protein